MFKVDALHRLAEKMSNQPRDVMVAGGASSAGTKFFSVPSIDCKAHEAIENLDRGGYRILLKRAENYNSDFKDLIQTLFRQVKDSLRDFGREKVVRLESGVLITSAATITPFHYDPEVGFFSQIQGDKAYHVYSPTVVREEELERFCARGPVTLAPVGTRRPRFDTRTCLQFNSGQRISSAAKCPPLGRNRCIAIHLIHNGF